MFPRVAFDALPSARHTCPLFPAHAYPSLRSQNKVPFDQRGFPEPPKLEWVLSVLLLQEAVPSHSTRHNWQLHATFLCQFWCNIRVSCQSVRRNLRRNLPALHQHMCSARHRASTKLQEGRVKFISYFILEAVELKESSHHFLWACGFLEGLSPNVVVTVPCCPVECLSPDERSSGVQRKKVRPNESR